MKIEDRANVQPEIEKRQHRRAMLITQVECEALGRQDLLLTRDVSVGGMFVRDDDPYPAESDVSVAFRLEPSAPLFTCRGKVAYAIKGLGMGIKFEELSAEVRQALQKFVDEAG